MAESVNPLGTKITRKRAMRYPRSLTALVSEDTYRAICDEAAERTESSGHVVSKGVVTREWIEIGRGVAEAAQSAAREAAASSTD